MEEVKRSRKKQLYKDIVDQIEFYFSPSNLSKDRFTRQLIDDHPDGIELSVFLKFNRLRALTSDTTVLAKALKRSGILLLSEDSKRVKLKAPIQQKENVDESTIYLEHLPADSTFEWLKKLFSTYGTVDYVSLPKYQNGKIKGFAFIEFGQPESAQSAIEDFKKCGGYLSVDMAPVELCSISSHEQEKRNTNRNGSTQSAEQPIHSEESDLVHSEHDISGQPGKKRKNETDEGTETPKLNENEPIESSKDDDLKVKRKKGEVETEPTHPEQTQPEQVNEHKDSVCDNIESRVAETETSSKKRKSTSTDCEEFQNKKLKAADDAKECLEGVDAEGSDILTSEEEADIQMESSNKRKRRKKKSSKKDKETAVNSGVHILSKNDWKRLRNKYLDAQRLQMANLKKKLSLNSRFKKPVWKDKASRFDRGKSAVNVQTPGSVVKLLLDEPVLEVKDFKRKLQNEFEGIQYVDVKEGSTEIYVRLSSADLASSFSSSSGYSSASIISGKEEIRYWSKISNDRERTKFRQKDSSTNHDKRACEADNGSKSENIKKDLHIVPGTIVKLIPTEPVIDLITFKSDLKSKFNGVSYIDLQEGSSEVYVRMDSKESADAVVDSNPSAVVIEGDEEKDYWNKIKLEKANKYENKSNVKRRGREKIIRKAEDTIRQHIYFTD